MHHAKVRACLSGIAFAAASVTLSLAHVNGPDRWEGFYAGLSVGNTSTRADMNTSTSPTSTFYDPVAGTYFAN